MSGSIGGRWRSRAVLRGLLAPGRCAETPHPDGPIGTSTTVTTYQTSGLPYCEADILRAFQAAGGDRRGEQNEYAWQGMDNVAVILRVCHPASGTREYPFGA